MKKLKSPAELAHEDLLRSVSEREVVRPVEDALRRAAKWHEVHGNKRRARDFEQSLQFLSQTPRDEFKKLLYGIIGPALRDLHDLCVKENAPAAVTRLFSVATEDAFDKRTVRGLIDTVLTKHPPTFLE
jgi:hypothetical protein